MSAPTTALPASSRVTVALVFNDGKAAMTTTVTRCQWDELASLFGNDVQAIGAALGEQIRGRKRQSGTA